MCMDISSKLAAFMAEKRLSQYELARISGVNQPTIQRILSGETADPKIGTLVNIAAALSVSVADLVPGGSARSPPHDQGVPVIALASVPVVCADTIVSPATMAIRWTPRPMKEHGHRTFAYQQIDDTMTAIAGPKSYPVGCLVYVDPDVTEVANDKPALVRLENGEVIMAYCMAQAGRAWWRRLVTRKPTKHSPPCAGFFTRREFPATPIPFVGAYKIHTRPH